MINSNFAALIAAGAILVTGGAAVAQQTPKPGSTMQRGQMQMNKTGMSKLTSSNREFLTKSAQDSIYEFASAQLAVQKAQSNEVAQYGLRLINDHATYNKQLMQLARQKEITLPVELDAEGRNKLARLSQLKGAAFDRQYIQQTKQANVSDVADLQREARTAKDRDVQAFIAQTLPVQQQHTRLASALQSNTNASSNTNSGGTNRSMR